MDALLENIPKPDRRRDMGVSLGVDLSKLDVCFGGFSPTLLGDSAQTLEKARESEERLRARRDALERAARIEAARASDVRVARDAQGNTWEYVILDGTQIRLERLVRPADTELDIPAVLAGLPVVALADDACALQDELECVRVPDSVVSLGYCVFRNCPQLARAFLPAYLATYDAGWFRNCQELRELQLPGQLDCLRPDIFDNKSLTELHIGAGTTEVYPGAFGRAHLTSISVSEENACLETDGIALYTKGRECLLAVAVDVAEYQVATACRMVGRKAMCGMGTLERVGLPDSLVAIGEHAFSHTALSDFVAPGALKAIQERAFFDCPQLARAELNEGLEELGANAFTRTALQELHLPRSIVRIGHPVAAETDIVYAGPEATFTIEQGAELYLDEQGALVRAHADGLHLEWLVDPQATELHVPDGVVRIDARALAAHKTLERVYLPDSVISVGEAAFKGCQRLREVRLSRRLERIEDEAFLDTSLEALDIPATLSHIGMMALVTQGPHSGRAPTTLADIAVDAANERFVTSCGMLLERAGGDQWRIVHYMDRVPDVVIPASAVAVAPYAFGGAHRLRSLTAHSSLSDVGMRAFAIDCLIDTIMIEMDEPVCGHSRFVFQFPATDRGEHQQFVALTSGAALDVASLFEHYDVAISNASNFDAVIDGRGLSLYDQAKRILERLQDPVFMTDVNRQMLERIVANQLYAICVAFAKHDDRAGIDALVELGFLNADTIEAAIESAGAVQDAAVTGYMLELRRRRFGHAMLDFEL